MPFIKAGIKPQRTPHLQKGYSLVDFEVKEPNAVWL